MIPEKLKVNKFKMVRIPSNKEYFARLGSLEVSDKLYTGDEPAPMPQNKVDTLALMDELDRQRQLDDDD